MDQIFKLASFVRPYWKRAALALVLLTALVFMDLAIPRLVQRIIDQGIGGHDQGVVVRTALLMLGISLLSALFAIGNNVLSVQVAESVARDLRDALFTRIQSFSFANLDEQKTGRLLVRLTSDANAVQRVVLISLRIGTRAPLLMVGSLVLMITTSATSPWRCCRFSSSPRSIIVLFVARMEPLFSSVQQRLDGLNTVLQENIAGARLVKSFVRADFEGERFEAANEAFTGRSVRVMQIMSSMSPILTMCVNVGMVIVIWVGGHPADRGGPHRRADRRLHELPPHHDDAAHHDDDALEHLGRRDRLGPADQRSPGYRARCPGRPGRDPPARARRGGGSSSKTSPSTTTARTPNRPGRGST